MVEYLAFLVEESEGSSYMEKVLFDLVTVSALAMAPNNRSLTCLSD